MQNDLFHGDEHLIFDEEHLVRDDGADDAYDAWRDEQCE